MMVENHVNTKPIEEKASDRFFKGWLNLLSSKPSEIFNID